MSTIHTEASVAASEVEPSASGVYDYSESINDNDEKMDEGLRAPTMHDDEMDTSLLSDNELEAFVKTKHYAGKGAFIPPNLQYIYQRLSGHSKWDPKVYQLSQIKTNSKNKNVPIHHYKASTFSGLPQIQGSPLQHDISYSEDPQFTQNQSSPILNQPEQSPFASITPAASQANMSMLEPVDSGDEDEASLQIKPRKQTLPFPSLPGSPTTATTTTLTTATTTTATTTTLTTATTTTATILTNNNSDKQNIVSFRDTSKTKKKEEKKMDKQQQQQQQTKKEDVAECTMKELMGYVSNLTSEVIHLQQSLYVKDLMIKNLYLRLKEFDHMSFPQLLIERIHIVANYNNKHKYNKHNHNKHKYNKRMTLSEEDSVSHDHYLGNGYSGYSQKIHPVQNSSNTFTATIKHHSTVTLEVITRWLPRNSLPIAVKKGLTYLKDDDIADIDDYITHQMWTDWQDKMKKYTINGLDKMKREEVHKNLTNYMQHERVGLVRIEILRGKKYKKYKRIEKKFESLIIPISDIPKGDTYHIMIKVHNPSPSIWGPLSNMVSIKVPLKFIDDDDTDNDNDAHHKTKSPKKTSNKTKK